MSAYASEDCVVNAWAKVEMTGLNILQTMSVYFSDNPEDGVPEDFTVEIFSGDYTAYSKTFSGNKAENITIEGFTVYNVTAIKITITKWNLPYRYPRIAEVLPGIYEKWGGDEIYSLDILHQADFSCLTIPYGTATLSIQNADKRFDPSNKSSLFKSIEEKQAIPIEMGLVTSHGVEYIPIGIFHQQNGGWATGNKGLTMNWKLVDIIGLLAAKKYTAPSTLPGTFSEWMASIVSQIGVNFADMYSVPESLAETELTCEASSLENITCGTLLRYICMATGTYPKSDPITGNLVAALIDDTTAGMITQDELSELPTIQANTDIASVTFKLPNGNEVVFAGTNSAAEKTVSINNPFLHTDEQLKAALKNILVYYGGNKYVAKERGNMASELGDVDLLEVSDNLSISGRRWKQQFSLQNGIQKNVSTNLLQATGGSLYTSYRMITEDSTIALDESITQIKVMLVGGGSGGEQGESGTYEKEGAAGAGGAGGKIYIFSLTINAGQSMTVHIGNGGAPGTEGDATTLTVGNLYSSESGKRYEIGLGDILTGNVFGKPGKVAGTNEGRENSGNGGDGGAGGEQGIYGTDDKGRTYIKRYPGVGGKGKKGGSGCAVIYWNEGE